MATVIDEEKSAAYAEQVEHVGTTTVKGDGYASTGSDADSDLTRFTLAETKRIIRRIDLRLVPIVGLMYCISLQDRVNLSLAALAGMTTDLKLTADPSVERYSIITLVFFITYVLFQPPTTILIRYFGPRYFLSGLTLSWAVIMIGMAFSKTWTPMIGMRLLLGILEAGFFPGVVYLLSTWYVRYDMGKRYAFFYCIGLLASALGGILAFGISQMKGIAGLNGWSWIFIIQGLITAVVAVLGFIFVIGFPDKKPANIFGTFLTPHEIAHVLARVDADRGDAHAEPFNFRKWLGGGADLKIWGFALIFGSTTTVTYALAYFLPQILHGAMGFSIGASQCLIAPPYVLAVINMLAVSWASDKYHLRAPAIAWNSMLCIIGLPIMGFAASPAVRYFGVFLATAGCNSNIPLVMTYQANNIRGHWKRAFCSATLVGMGGMGGIVGSTVFRARDAPGYVPGLSVAIGANVLILLIIGALSLMFTRANKRADRDGTALEGEIGFRYTL